jgi:hypothetical protein
MVMGFKVGKYFAYNDGEVVDSILLLLFEVKFITVAV